MNREIEARHTPGPWKVFNAGPHYNNQAIDNLQIQYGEDGECISDHVYTQADARLIAAAPELLEALEPFAKFACDPPCDCHNCKARSAIAKARGAK